MADRTDLVFPCDRLPDDAHSRKLLGVYPQRQEGRCLQRVRIIGGGLPGPQWRGLAAIARQFTPDTPLHLTTRQDVELHDLSADAIGPVQHLLAEAGLTGLGGGGDTLRNIVVDPGSGVQAGSIDLLPLARQVQQVLWEYDRIFELPRKFKVSFSIESSPDGQPWINDLGLVARLGEGGWGFLVIAAGSLGPRPATGLLVFDWLSPGDVPPLALAAVRLFDAHGDRKTRSIARLRHVRQRLGDQPFVDLLWAEFERARGERDWPAVTLPAAAAGLPARVDLTFPNGDVPPDAADALARLADQDSPPKTLPLGGGKGEGVRLESGSSAPALAVRITADHRVAVFGPSVEGILASVQAEAALRSAAQPQPTIVACPGTRWCSRGIVDTNSAAGRIRQALGSGLSRLGVQGASGRGGQPSIRISGCPNGCAHSRVAGIGLIGRMVTVDGQRQEAFDVFTGGGLGGTDKLAGLAAAGVPADEVAANIARLIQLGDFAPV